MMRLRSLAAVVGVSAVLAAMLATPPARAATGVTLAPTADTLVHSSNKTSTYGTSTSLSAYGSPDVESFLRFVLPAEPSGQTLTAATLTIRTTTLSSAGTNDTLSVRSSTNTWAETTVNYNTRPVVSGPVLGTLAHPATVNTAFPITLDPALVRPLLGASTSLAITGSGGDGFFFSSREAAAATRPSLVLTFSPSGPADTTAPDAPSELEIAVNGFNCLLDWNASFDDVGTVAYDVYRSDVNGFVPGPTNRIATTTTASYEDNGRPPGHWFYVVTARDAAGNTSAPSPQQEGIVEAPPPPPPPSSTVTTLPVADTLVHASNKTTNYGTNTSLSTYGSPDIESLFRFAVPGLPSGQVLSTAALRVQTTTLSSGGSANEQRVRLTDNSWNETTVTYNTRPPVGALLGTIPGAPAVNTRYDVPLDINQVGPLLGTTASFALLGSGTDGAYFSSREGVAAARPLLVLGFASGTPDTQPPTAPADLVATVGPTAVGLTWTASTDDVSVTRYDVHRSTTPGFVPDASTLIGTSTQPGYTDPIRELGTFSYVVIARDGAPNSSPPSNEATAEVTALPVVTRVAAFGDAACAPGYTTTTQVCRQGDVAAVLGTVDPDYLVALGDLQYPAGTLDQFNGSWDPTFGSFKSRTLPVLGNHEFTDPAGGSRGYFDYFYSPGVNAGTYGDRGFGYYTTTVGAWQFIGLDSECAGDAANGNHFMAGGCDVGSPQYQWLSDTLNASTASCTVVAYHRPRWSSGPNPSYAAMAPMWDLMVSKGVDVVLNGHDHDTEVLNRIGVSGTSTTPVQSATGIREFVVGTGGKDLSPFPSGTSAVRSATQARDQSTFGALVLTLKDGSFDWAYTPIAGKTYTNTGTSGAFSGTDEACH
jgi:hypothetical protein